MPNYTHTKNGFGIVNGDVVIICNAGVPDATVGAGVAGAGSMCIDTTAPNLYINGGTKAVPAWKLVTRAA
jgi:hypothetical protein